MYVCICLVNRINQRVFRNSSLQMFSMRMRGKQCRSQSNRRPSAGASREADSIQYVCECMCVCACVRVSVCVCVRACVLV